MLYWLYWVYFDVCKDIYLGLSDGNLGPISSSLLVLFLSPILSFITYGYAVGNVLIHSVSLGFPFWKRKDLFFLGTIHFY